MDADRFDTFVRAFSQARPRRFVLGSLGRFGLAGALSGGTFSLAAAGNKKHKKKKHKHDKKHDKKDDCNPPCGGGTLCCHGHCVDVLTDRNNCGECGKQCGAAQLCANKQCMPCDEPLAVCTVAGQEICVDVRSDPNNCDSCGNACPKDPETPARNFICQDRKCVCTGKTCNNGRCCPHDFDVCVGDGIGCCPTNFPVPCGNGRCCPAGTTCGGSCGKECCK